MHKQMEKRSSFIQNTLQLVVDNKENDMKKDKNVYWKLMDDIRTEHITRLTKEEWSKIQ